VDSHCGHPAIARRLVDSGCDSRYTASVVRLVDKETGREVGSITDEQLEYLQAELEEESLDDQDYWFDVASLDILEESGADPALIAILRSALGDRDEMELRWERA
jgi:processive 1,2-diacylglycerol beta-glucosyltransferase